MLGFIFPGQGSQSVGMGREIYDAFRSARDVFDAVDDALSFPLRRLIFEGPQETLTETEFTQPALMTVSMAVMAVLTKDGGLKVGDGVHAAAGHSLGEYTALAATEVLTLSDAAHLLRTRGQAMQKAVPLGQGTMAALLGATIEEAEGIARDAAEGQVCEVANDNAPGQVVISGHVAAIERAAVLAKDRGVKRCMILPVSAPFHCALMAPAADVMTEALSKVRFDLPACGVVTNVDAALTQAPEDFAPLLVRQITGRVRWRESMLEMRAQGVTHLYEIGAGRVLSGLAKRIDPDFVAESLLLPEEIEAFLKTL